MAYRNSRTRMLLALFCALLPLVATTGAAPDQKGANQSRRLALVIGNRAYPDRPLLNPVNDAEAVRDALTDVGFEVDYAHDLNLASLQKAVNAFSAKLRLDDIALFYFAGHGVQVQGQNYLIPVDFAASNEDEVIDHAYSLERIKERMEAKQTQLNILILDACRDNPYHFGRGEGGRGLSAPSEGIGTLIAFAAKDGQVAADNPSQKNGLYTKFLLDEIRKPGVEIKAVFDLVQADVYSASSHKQFPYMYGGVVNKFYFRPPVFAGGVTTYDMYAAADVANAHSQGRLTVRLLDGGNIVVAGSSTSGGDVSMVEAEWRGEGTLTGSDATFSWSYPKDGRKGTGKLSVHQDGSIEGTMSGAGIDLHFHGIRSASASKSN